MRYYIIHTEREPISDKLVEDIFRKDVHAVIVSDIKECDVAVTQSGWTNSEKAVDAWIFATAELRKVWKDAHVFQETD